MSALLKPTESGFWQMVRFGLVGAVATVVDFAVLAVLTHFDLLSHFVRSAHLRQQLAVAAGYAAGLIICYIFSILWVFSHRSVSNKQVEFAIFMLIGVAGLVLTEVCVELCLRVLSRMPFIMRHLAGHLPLYLAKCIAIVVVFFFNFVTRKMFLFKGPKAPTAS